MVGGGRVFRVQAWGEDEAEVVVEGDQAAVEGSVVEDVEGDAVVGVGSAFLFGAPRDDVACVEEFGDGKACDGAGVLITDKHGVAEEALDAARADGSLDFGRALRLLPRGDGFGRHFLVKTCRGGFGFRRDDFGVVLELLPEFGVGTGEVGQASDASCAVRRIEAGEVAGLHSDGVGGAADLFCDGNDFRLGCNKLPERHAAIVAKDNQQLLAGPCGGSGHGESFAFLVSSFKLGRDLECGDLSPL